MHLKLPAMIPYHRTLRRSLLAAIALAGSACAKDAPGATGSAEVTFTTLRSNFAVGFPSGSIGFEVYTEASYAGFQRVSPLRQGQTPITLSADGVTYKSVTTVENLNPGNYVFVLGSAFATSIQVTANRTNPFAFTY